MLKYQGDSLAHYERVMRDEVGSEISYARNYLSQFGKCSGWTAPELGKIKSDVNASMSRLQRSASVAADIGSALKSTRAVLEEKISTRKGALNVFPSKVDIRGVPVQPHVFNLQQTAMIINIPPVSAWIADLANKLSGIFR